jgi:hypothetical protein
MAGTYTIILRGTLPDSGNYCDYTIPLQIINTLCATDTISFPDTSQFITCSYDITPGA